jgi:hypothetical protein
MVHLIAPVVAGEPAELDTGQKEASSVGTGKLIDSDPPAPLSPIEDLFLVHHPASVAHRIPGDLHDDGPAPAFVPGRPFLDQV